jgi:enoyl-CoA hydratase/carnithine racemase
VDEAVIFTVDEHVAHVQLNRPAKKNAIDQPMFAGILDAARRAREDASIRCVVLSGNGGCFSSGLDLASFGEMADGNLSADREDVRESLADVSQAGASRHQQLGWAWQEIACPVIAAVEGVAYGGGFHIALGADIRIMAPDARVAFVETTWGLVPDMSGTQALRRLVPLDVAKLLVFLGEVVDGKQALAYNLATRLSDTPVVDALAIARTIAGRSPDAMRAAKQLLNDSAFVSLAEGLANEFKASGSLLGTPNQIEAVMAKFEKRPAKFTDPS